MSDIQRYLREKIITETDKRLEKELRKIFNDDDFVLGVFAYIDDEQAKKELIEYISNNESVTSDEICLISLDYKLNIRGNKNEN